jgi:hypothetical protein
MAAPISIVDRRDEGEAGAAGWMQAELGRPFDLTQAAAACTHTLIQIGAKDWIFCFRYRHVLLDAYGAYRYLL